MTDDETPALSPAARRLLWLIANRPGFLGVNRPPGDDEPPFVYGQSADDDDSPWSVSDLRLFRAAGATRADLKQLLALKQWDIARIAKQIEECHPIDH